MTSKTLRARRAGHPALGVRACGLTRMACTGLVALLGAAFASACGGGGSDAPPSASRTPAQAQARAQTPPSLWGADGRPLPTAAEDRPAEASALHSQQRFASRAQLAHEELVAAPYTVVIDADDEAGIVAGLMLAEQVGLQRGERDAMGVFVRSRRPDIAARLAEHLTREQGWRNVFVVI